jgi:hypothetical protein
MTNIKNQASNIINLIFTLIIILAIGICIGSETGAKPKPGLFEKDNSLQGIKTIEVKAKEIQPLSSVNSATSQENKENKENTAQLIEETKKIIGDNPSPISPERWVELSQELDFPLDFMLAVAHNESHFGTRGRAVETKNIFNVGNTDCGDGKPVQKDHCNNFIDSYELGVLEFAKLIKNCYFEEDEQITIEKWIERDFRAVRCEIKGKRYMTDKFSKFKYNSIIKKLTNLKKIQNEKKI